MSTTNVQLPALVMKYPNMNTIQSRLQTFNSWTNNEVADVDSMVDAGFFYTGIEDHVRCFNCGIGLRNWEPEDDHIVEHARWSPNCKFVIDKKGQEFIDAVQAAVRQIDIEDIMGLESISLNGNITRNETEESATVPTLPIDVLPCGRPPTAMEKKNPLLTPAGQALVEYGYLPKYIKIAVEVVLKDRGWKHLTSTSLMETINNLVRNGQIPGDSIKQPCLPSKYLKNRLKRKCRSSETKRRLFQENSEMKERISCKICCEDIVTIAFLPCGHLVSCIQCAPSLTKCPVCRTEIKGTFKVLI